MIADQTMDQGRQTWDLSSLLRPTRVAVVGANDRTAAFTGGTIVNLVRHGFEGEVYPVNPRRDRVGGLRAFPDVRSLPTAIDTAVIVVPADLVVPMLHDCVGAGATSAIVVSSGFGEGATSDAGRRRARELTDFLSEQPIPILGPSTTGLVNLNDGYVPRAVTNHLPPERLHSGPIALISQSGAANNAVFNRAQSHGVPIGLAVATGIQANLNVWDVVAAVLPDPRITVIALLVEELGGPAQYESVLRSAAAHGKPVVILRTGRSDVGGRAIRTHTGSLAGNWVVEEEMLRSLGATVVSDLDQLWEVASVATHWGRPPDNVLRLGVIGLSGGEGALIADQATDAGMHLPPVSDRFERLVAANLELAGAGNPFDPTGEAMGRPENGMAAIEGFVTTNDFDAHLVSLNAQSAPTEGGLLDGIVATLRGAGGRIALSYWDIPGYSDGLVDVLADFPGPILPGSHRVVAAIGAWSRTRPVLESILESPCASSNRAHLSTSIGYWEARQWLESLGVRFGAAELATSPEDAVRAARDVGYPVVLKANVESTVHKAAAGLIRLGLRDDEDVSAAVRELFEHTESIVVERAVLAAALLIIGTIDDPQAGSVVVVGSGGGAAEELKDAAVCPVRFLNPSSARAALRRTAIGRFLEKRHHASFEQAADLMVVLGRSVDGDAMSVEMNPLAVTDDGLIALDARIDLHHSTLVE
ncbi:acetate--CoA ligase family protein [Leekyejoonella antrihumi]|uniref:ATP-grasp domain-containing protein n=1 Tax=Leekyejoonella antrihumi TaxID=1660198 RepID=A0A563E6P2_9MICO|nr:acetate--CoA ligase family protein [Leekyejoonella antrihumi]TWP37933.1 hypothetical protein FGL98_04280 [Leekyejoonella antrihumi]